MHVAPQSEMGSLNNVTVCSCGYKHQSDPPAFVVPLQFLILFHVVHRNPLKLGPSSEMVVGPFHFPVKAGLVR